MESPKHNSVPLKFNPVHANDVYFPPKTVSNVCAKKDFLSIYHTPLHNYKNKHCNVIKYRHSTIRRFQVKIDTGIHKMARKAVNTYRNIQLNINQKGEIYIKPGRNTVLIDKSGLTSHLSITSFAIKFISVD